MHNFITGSANNSHIFIVNAEIQTIELNKDLKAVHHFEA